MAGANFTTDSQPIGDINFNGGLNSTSGPLSVKDNESSDLQNIDFNKFGSILKRNGYQALNTSAISGDPASDGLWWYEFVTAGSYDSKFVNITNGKFYKMDDLDATWDDVTGAVTITAGNFCDFENWLNTVYVTNNNDAPFKWTGSGNAAAMTVPTGLTKAKCVVQFNNYLFLGNVVVSGTTYKSRFYWSNLRDDSTWLSTSFIEISKDDGQQIQNMFVMGDRLVVFKERSIYNVFFTGDADIPFTVQKSNSNVGCAAPFSVQEIENGLVFLSYDGFYYYDGNNSYKISFNIQNTLLDYNSTRFHQARSMRQKTKNRYFCSLPSSGQTNNDVVVVWDWFLNAFSIYTGIAGASMASVYVSGITERIYFGDYSGFVYRMDIGTDDYPLNVQTAIDAYYYTNWKNYSDLCDQKGIPNVYIYYQTSNSVLTFAYSYDFEDADTYTQTFSLSTGVSVYGTAVYGTGTYAGIGGYQQRRDLDGRGRVTRLKFANNTIGETFQIHGLGSFAHLETNV
jgi:hypothetical protein